MIKALPGIGEGICVIEPRLERLTAANATGFRDELLALLEKGEDRLLVDMSGVEFVDSSGIGAMVGVLKRIGNRGEIAICGLSGSVQKMFGITRMDRVFAVYRDRDTAIAAMNERA
ncbi:STAS domain-containing protein [Paracoccus sp. 1_MG-2023]|uniref:STAS domain-containing protein n=1 Tax=unclassified Paracoccus (in: a-proteobacteria) TaxID=2688777 RepID=UPI001C07F430|nr:MULTISPECIES: STAS domain-containing protein [unclassified Paracoccus (in: a-proteobacteria)]MBU2958864.1 STAS domain-containing protein [Paracoccus sp. C2R09]MDO6670004.1 STAS domain-containing protein [Paracoccus sp. 1_MG-2023]